MGKNSDLGGKQRENFDLKEDDPAPEEEGGVERDAAHVSELEQQRDT